MPHIIVDEEQARIISEASGDIEVRDRSGRHLGYMSHGFSSEDIADAERRADSDGPWHTTAEVLDGLQSPGSP